MIRRRINRLTTSGIIDLGTVDNWRHLQRRHLLNRVGRHDALRSPSPRAGNTRYLRLRIPPLPRIYLTETDTQPRAQSRFSQPSVMGLGRSYRRSPHDLLTSPLFVMQRATDSVTARQDRPVGVILGGRVFERLW